MKGRITRWIAFIGKVAADRRIPARDRAVLGGIIVWLASPVDLIPDFLPVIGYLDDLIVVVLLLDYVFNEIPLDVLADHYPGEPTALLRMRRRTRRMGRLIPRWFKRKLWAQVEERPAEEDRCADGEPADVEKLRH